MRRDAVCSVSYRWQKMRGVSGGADHHRSDVADRQTRRFRLV
ncbi:hypothetical protein ECP030529311_5113 [Escherichia coli p0305293.11]|nr:hypothetical protein ECP030529311_5113 [Escherichia coli p0305293.11]